jgi:TetR/AcrR family transcriptional repressor of nem operon
MMMVIMISPSPGRDIPAMKVSREQVQQNRERILEAAARLFRERGFDGVSVAEVMKAAGLTHGGFYGHFESKDALIKEAMSRAMPAAATPMTAAAATAGGAGTTGIAGIAGTVGTANRSARKTREQSTAAFADAYLSPRHRDDRGGGCPVAGLGSEAARASADVRGALTTSIRKEIERFTAASRATTQAARRRSGITTYAAMIGALTLARIVDDTELSEEILHATRKSLDVK